VSGELLGRRLLRLDAVYCAGAGFIAIVFSVPLARLLETPRGIPVVAGVATVVWAALLLRLAGRGAWRASVTAVAAANGLAAVGLGGVAALVPGIAASLLLAAVAIEVAAFAGAQAVAVQR
jgi:hypothetical protein